MKRTEVVTLGGKEYTLELNRDSFIQIDKICDIQKSLEIIQRGLYDYVDEIDDDYNPLESIPNEESMEKEIELKENTLKKIVERAFFIWLYPNHKLPISEVKKIIDPYFESEEKSNEIGIMLGKYLEECVSIKQNYDEQEKNLKAQANK